MTWQKQPISSSECWKLARIIPISKTLRWHVGRQYHSDFGAYNHPFWAHLQRRWCLIWLDAGELYDPFYPKDGESLDTFYKRVEKELATMPPPHPLPL